MYPAKGIPTTSGPYVPLPGYQREAIPEDCCLCTGPAVLGREGQPANARQTKSFGEMGPWTKEGDGIVVSFSDDAILDDATSPEGSLEDLTRVTIPGDAPPASTGTSTKEEPAEEPAHMEVTTEEAAPAMKPLKGSTYLPVTVSNPTEKPTALQAWHEEQRKVEAPDSNFPGWTKVLHSPQPVTAVEPIPLDLGESKQRHHSQSTGGRTAQYQRVEEHLQTMELHPVSPPESPKLVQEIALPSGLTGVVACLQRDPSPKTTAEAPREPMQLEIIMKPAIATMCTSCIAQNETMGVTYMDMATTSMGRMALSSSRMVTCPPGSTIEDVTDLPREGKDDNHL